MIQISYVSTAALNLSTQRVRDILIRSQAYNAEWGVTGLLIYDRQWFMQVIEGPEKAMRTLYARICADDRHHGVTQLSDEAISARDFGDWAMAWNPVEPAGVGQPLDEIVRALTEQVGNPVTRELLRKFVPLARTASDGVTPSSRTPR